MTDIRDVFNKAMENKKNDLNTFIWKFPKDRNNKNQQSAVKLMDCSEEELQGFYNHCISMLRNTDKFKPGRYDVLGLIRLQKDRIGAELLMRELEADPMFTRFALNDAIMTYIEKMKSNGINIRPEYTTFDNYYEYELSSKYNKLTLKTILEACNDKLGLLDCSHLTKSFILKRGIWIKSKEVKLLTDYAKENSIEIKGDTELMPIVRSYLKLRDHQVLKPNPKGLSITEMYSALNIRPCKISDLTTEQLKVLRYKLLLDLERNVLVHIEKWETLMQQIEKVAKAKKFNLK